MNIRVRQDGTCWLAYVEECPRLHAIGTTPQRAMERLLKAMRRENVSVKEFQASLAMA